ncbi:MAG TPA: phosphate ABC transporter permease subunit PstC [Hanamia sp.]
MTTFLLLPRKWIDRISNTWLNVAVIFLLLLPLVIGLGLVLKSLPLFHEYSLGSLIGSSDWSPLEGKFGFYAFIIGSLLVTLLSFVLSAPVCLLAAIYLTQYAPRWLMQAMYFVIDVLAGIPSVVYGAWGVLVVVPLISEHVAPAFGFTTTGYCLLSGGVVLAIMAVPYMLNMLMEVLRSIPIELKEASLSLGATYWETIKWILLRQGKTGIIAALSLGISKALGETIAVLMVVGNVAQVPHNIFQPAYPLPALIANNYGDMMSVPLYDAALMLSALLLFVIIIVVNALTNLLVYKTGTNN